MISKATDFGRFIGASAVFYYHVGIATAYPLSQWGEYAVSFFIILAGVAYTGFSAVKPTDLRSYRRYIGRRIGAIYLPFVAINFVIFASSFWYASALGRPFTFVEFLLSSSGLSQYCNHRYLSTVMWFVPFIMQAYLLFPLIDSLLNRVPALLMILCAFTLSLILIVLVCSHWPLRAVEICRNWSVLFRLPEVCMGLVVGRCTFFRRELCGGLSALAAFALLSFVLATALSAHFVAQAYILSLPWNGLVVTVAIAGASIAAAVAFENRIGRPLIQLIGTASFPFFLAHGVAILLVFHRFGNNAAVWVLYFIICWIGAIFFTFVFRHAKRRRGSCT